MKGEWIEASKTGTGADMLRIGVDVRTVRAAREGIGNYTLELIRGLVGLGTGAQFVWYGDSRTEQALLPAGEIRIGPDGPLWHPWAARRGDREVALFHSPGSLFLPLLARRSLVLTVHDLVPIRLPDSADPWSRLTYRVFRAAVRRARSIIADSAFTARDLAAFAPESQTKTHAVLLASRFPIAGPQVSLPEGLESGFILAVGSLDPRKNLKRLLAAHARLKTPPPLVVAGRKAWRSGGFESAFAAHPHPIRVIRDSGDAMLQTLYSRCSVFVFPSTYEGFGLPVVEAMACGAPVIASTATAVPEAAGGAAILVDPEDVAALASAITRVLKEPSLRADLVDRGRRHAASRTWADVARETYSVYRASLLDS